MAYTPKTWACGDTITADELNRMEEGISSAQGGGGTPLVVNVVAEGSATTLDKTWQEIYDAFPAAYIGNSNGGKTSITEVFEGKGVYRVRVSANNDVTEYTTDVASGYPSHGEK